MRPGRRSSDALLHSISEFAYILVFVTIGAALVLYAGTQESRRRAEELEEDNRQLRQQVASLNEILQDKRYGVVPCWRRPEGQIPRVVAVISILDQSFFQITRNTDGTLVQVGQKEASEEPEPGPTPAFDQWVDPDGGDTLDPRDFVERRQPEPEPEPEPPAIDPRERLKAELLALLKEETSFSDQHNCYLRVRIENQTNDYGVYEEIAHLVTNAGMVVARD